MPPNTAAKSKREIAKQRVIQQSRTKRSEDGQNFLGSRKWILIAIFILMCSGAWTLFSGLGRQKAPFFDLSMVNDRTVIKHGSNNNMKLKENSDFAHWTLSTAVQSFKRVAFSQYTTGGDLGQNKKINKNAQTLPSCNTIDANMDLDSTVNDLSVEFEVQQSFPECRIPVYQLAKSNCSSSYATAVAATFSARQCVSRYKKGDSNTIEAMGGLKMIPYSAQDLMNCHTRLTKGCAGALVDAAALAIEEEGIVTESCFQWRGGSGLTACQRCSTETPTKSGGTCRVKIDPATKYVDIKRELSTRGPLIMMMHVTDELLLYKEGIFRASRNSRRLIETDTAEGSRFMVSVPLVVTGWSTQGGGSWRVVAPFGNNWGDGGYGLVSFDSIVGDYGVTMIANNQPPQEQLVGEKKTKSMNAKKDASNDKFIEDMESEEDDEEEIMDL